MERLATRLLHIMDWVPARVSALGCAVVGDFNRPMQRWVASWNDPVIESRRLLFECADQASNQMLDSDSNMELTAASLNQSLQGLVELMQRLLMFWLALVAIATLMGWG